MSFNSNLWPCWYTKFILVLLYLDKTCFCSFFYLNLLKFLCKIFSRFFVWCHFLIVQINNNSMSVQWNRSSRSVSWIWMRYCRDDTMILEWCFHERNPKKLSYYFPSLFGINLFFFNIFLAKIFRQKRKTQIWDTRLLNIIRNIYGQIILNNFICIESVKIHHFQQNINKIKLSFKTFGDSYRDHHL